MGIYDDLKKNLGESMYNTGQNTLEEKISGYGGSQGQEYNSIPTPKNPSFEGDYRRILRLAEEHDTFQGILNSWRKIAQRAAEWGQSTRAQQVLRQAHELYAQTQQNLAEAFAEAGDFENAELHLANAHIEVGGDLSLPRQIRADDAERILDTAMKNTSPAYFIERVQQAAQEGDVAGIDKHVSYAFRAVKVHGLLKIPIKRTRGVPLERNEYIYHQFGRKMTQYSREAYERAIITTVEEAIGYAVKKRTMIGGKGAIKDRQIRVKDLMLDMVNKFEMPWRKQEGYDTTFYFFSALVDPLFSLLLECERDPNHTLRRVYQEEKREEFGDVSGATRQTTSAALVSRSFYGTQFERTGTAILVDSLFAPVANMYARETGLPLARE
ncbi:MAG: hypothetical protein OXR66_06945 [Candidatus Woesearchaeota archaeon]|nr:hypothetical protein [Candidatus Woesearchaeota archaeon]